MCASKKNQIMNIDLITDGEDIEMPSIIEYKIDKVDEEYYKDAMIQDLKRKNTLLNASEPIFQFYNNVYMDQDCQNAHDVCVQKMLTNIYEKNRKWRLHNNDIVITNIIKYIEKSQHLSPDEKAKCQEVISKMIHRSSISSLYNGESEIDVLCTIWFFGNENVRVFLLKQIGEFVDENENLYCPSGIIARIIYASGINHPELLPKTKKLLNEEMLAKASTIIHKNKTKSTRYIKTLLVEEFSKDYEGILDRSTIKCMIDDWFTWEI